MSDVRQAQPYFHGVDYIDAYTTQFESDAGDPLCALTIQLKGNDGTRLTVAVHGLDRVYAARIAQAINQINASDAAR